MKSLKGPEIPAASGKTKQLIVFLHGVGADGNDLISLADIFSEAFPNAHFCSPHAPFAFDMAPPGFAAGYQWFSLQEYMQQSPEAVMKNRTTSRNLLAGAAEAAPYLNDFIDAKLKALGLDDSALILIGFSQGTMMALYTSLRRNKPCAAVIGYSGALLGADVLAKEIVSRPPVCLIHGAVDMVVPHQMMRDAEAGLKANKVPVEAHTRPQLAHGIDPEGVGIAIRFLVKHLQMA
ncbi:MAG: phospholipase [Proteobacteria bacterium]|nr:phospholipase [Pseudomonadota bacterium]